jgi:hypothetical protein
LIRRFEIRRFWIGRFLWFLMTWLGWGLQKIKK